MPHWTERFLTLILPSGADRPDQPSRWQHLVVSCEERPPGCHAVEPVLLGHGEA